MPTLTQLLILARVPNVPTVWSNVLMAWALAGGGPWGGLITALLGGTLLYAGGCTLNDAFDADWDRVHKPDRIIPCGALKASTVWTWGIGEMLGGFILMTLAAPDFWFLPLALALAILIYDFHHKESPLSVVIMGGCRALLVLSAAAAAGNPWDPRIIGAAAVMWIYIIGVSLLARRESRPGGGVLRALRPEWSVGRWVGELLAAIPLVDAVLLVVLGVAAGKAGHEAAPGGPAGLGGLALGVAGLWPLCRLIQRKYAAT